MNILKNQIEPLVGKHIFVTNYDKDEGHQRLFK